MSDKGIDSAVERILRDPEFAKRVFRDPERTLTREFDLEWGEWRSIHWSLLQDVAEAVDFGRVKFDLVRQIPRVKGRFDRNAMQPTVHA
jgi:hypothetical protein